MYSSSYLVDKTQEKIYPNHEQMNLFTSDVISDNIGLKSQTDSSKSTLAIVDTVKRKRTKFSLIQLQMLENEFRSGAYLSNRRRSDLAKQLSLKESHIKVWFQNRRMKHKRDTNTEKFQNKIITNKIMKAQNQHSALVHRLLSYSQNMGGTKNFEKTTKNSNLYSMKENQAHSKEINCTEELYDNSKESASVVSNNNNNSCVNKLLNERTVRINQGMFDFNDLNNLNNEKCSFKKWCNFEHRTMYFQNPSTNSQIVPNQYEDDVITVDNPLNITQNDRNSSNNYCQEYNNDISKTFVMDGAYNTTLSVSVKNDTIPSTMEMLSTSDNHCSTTPQTNARTTQHLDQFSTPDFNNVIEFGDIWYN